MRTPPPKSMGKRTFRHFATLKFCDCPSVKSEETSKEYPVKINQSTSTRPADNAAGDAARPAAAGATPQDPAALTGVRVSPLAAHVREIANRLVNDTDDDIDTAKVEEIRQAIAEGRIKIDPSKIADGLLASLRELSQGDTQPT
ncbi:hypothetical protein LMG32289_04792 [Cupriavidus pampae]|uniref:Negative regulator of flagellin synthesis n=1 Tax=Cupriavidus pampae TaxID=659251 RepID=A0ABN7ZAY3_9BURK|nr:hypothetical protein LMG32289_04792 [Cupriavidus pampae]